MSDISWILEAPIKVLLESVVDEFVKRNSDFQYQAGLQPKVIRRTTAVKPCPWCMNLAGTYNYPDVPREVWQRHDNCHCIVEYIPVKGSRQTVHSGTEGKRRYVKEKPEYNYGLSKEARIKRAEEMAKTEKVRKEVARQKRIDTWGKKKETSAEVLEKRKKIGLENESERDTITIHRSLGAAAKRYEVRLMAGDHGELKENSKITKVKTFAGKGTSTEIRERFSLETEYGHPANQWRKVRGEGIVIENGKERKVEIHWYEANGERVKMKVKRYLDET